MQWHKLRLKVVLAALLATLIVLFGGQWLYTKYSLQQPLKEILADDGIRYYRIEEEPVLRVYVRLNHPSDLMDKYHELNEKIGSTLGNRPYRLIVEDKRNPALEKAYYQSQFAIHTAIVQGDFEGMAQKIEQNAAAVGAEAKVWIDGENIYVYMWQDDFYLVEVVPRSVTSAGPNHTNGGGLYAERA